MAPLPKYPRTPWWPTSPSLSLVGSSGKLLADPDRFVGRPIVITEKLDGSCTLLHRGEVYARSVAVPSAFRVDGALELGAVASTSPLTGPDTLAGDSPLGPRCVRYVGREVAAVASGSAGRQ